MTACVIAKQLIVRGFANDSRHKHQPSTPWHKTKAAHGPLLS